MVVDNANVVIESIIRCREEGDELVPAVLRGTREVAGAIVASTATTVAVFLPIVFVHGIAGQIFGDQALTVVTSMLVSLGVAIYLVPMLASRRWLSDEAWSARSAPVRVARPWAGLDWSGWSAGTTSLMLLIGRSLLALGMVLALVVGGAAWLLYRAVWILTWPLRAAFDWSWSATERTYPRLLAGSLSHPLLVLGIAGLLFTASLLRLDDLGVELLPEIHQGEFTAHVGLGVGTPIETTDELLSAVDAQARALDGVSVTALTVGVERDTLTREIEGNHTGRLTLRLDPERATAEREAQLVDQVRALLAARPEVESIDVSRPTPFALEAPITVEVLGHDLEAMAVVADEVHGRLAQVEGLTDVQSSVRPGHPEARVIFDRDKMLELGLDLGRVSNLVRDQVLGNVRTRFNEGEERIDVRVIGDEILLSDVEHVLDLVVNPEAQSPVELRSVASIERVQGPAEIRRIGNTRAFVLSAAGTGLDLGGLTARIDRSLASLVTPDEVQVELGGQKRELDEAQRSMRFALFLALFLVYVVMACQFESLLQPLIVLLTVPLALVGVVVALELTGTPLSVLVFIGMIILAGVVVSNGIVLIDRINQLLAAGQELTAAVLEAGGTRLRPIVMTAGTTVIGLLPMTGWFDGIPWVESWLGGGAGAEMRAPLAVTVIAGLSVSTLLTLVVIPVVYHLVARLSRRARPTVPPTAPPTASTAGSAA
jgi:HAE1 family hydrophobic/amphiphilic exporter-1